MQRIGVLEDNHALGRLLDVSLRNTGYDVKVYQKTTDFLDRPEYDLIIVDFRLLTERGETNMSGADVIRQIKKLRPEMPAILISALSFSTLKRAAGDIPGLRIMEKPFKISSLVGEIQTLLANRPSLHGVRTPQ